MMLLVVEKKRRRDSGSSGINYNDDNVNWQKKEKRIRKRCQHHTMALSKRGQTGLEAYSGSPPTDDFPLANTFDFCFSQPFLSQSGFNPAAHRVPRIPDEKPVFIDNASGESLLSLTNMSSAVAGEFQLDPTTHRQS